MLFRSPNFNHFKFQYAFSATPLKPGSDEVDSLGRKEEVFVNVEYDDFRMRSVVSSAARGDGNLEKLLGAIAVRYLEDGKYDFSEDRVPVISESEVEEKLINISPIDNSTIVFPPKEDFFILSGGQVGF